MATDPTQTHSADTPRTTERTAPMLADKLKTLREKFDALLLRELDVFGGIPVHGGRTGKEQEALREAVADVLASEPELAALRASEGGRMDDQSRSDREK